ncbi:endonuclease domain-containing protein [Aeromonas salmonicida]|uniref:endonuclease domain-containing protein n=1 Tax=Aeromonas salmonicida TaxID=645 RepID=UPI003D200469
MVQQLKTTEVQKQRDLFIKQQQGLCVLCEQPIERPCLDHAHAGEPHEHHVRGACCAQCNSCLGAIWKKLQRSGLLNRLGQQGAVRWLVNAASYYQQDYSMNPYHPNRCTDLARQFKTKGKPEQLAELKRLGVEAELKKGTKEQLLKLYKKHITKNPH